MAAWSELGGVRGGLGWPAGEKHLDRGGGSKSAVDGRGRIDPWGERITEWQPFFPATIYSCAMDGFFSSRAGEEGRTHTFFLSTPQFALTHLVFALRLVV